MEQAVNAAVLSGAVSATEATKMFTKAYEDTNNVAEGCEQIQLRSW